MCRCSNQRARITPGTRLSANHCAHDRWWSHTRASGSVDSPSNATPGPTASSRPGRASFIVSRKSPSAPRSRTSPAIDRVVAALLLRRRGLPRVVAEEDAHAARLEVADELRQVGHVAVVVELAALVDPLHRIRVPEHDAVEPAERLVPGEVAVGREALRGVVVEPLVVEPRERDREAALRPRELGALVRAAVVVDARPRPRRASGRGPRARPASRPGRRARRRSSRRRAPRGRRPESSGTARHMSIGRGTSGSRGASTGRLTRP